MLRKYAGNVVIDNNNFVDDAKSLYRAIPPETRLFVVPKQ